MPKKRVKWKDAPDDTLNQIENKKLSPDGKLFMGVHPVLFGARIRAGYEGAPTCHIDWCCGADQALISITYHMVLNYLELGGDLFKLPRVSHVKPWFNDPHFVDKTTEIMEEYNIEAQK